MMTASVMKELKPCEAMTKHIGNSAIAHYSAIFRDIQNLAQNLFMPKPRILRMPQYSEPFHNFSRHIEKLVIFTKIYKYPEL